MCVIRRIRVKIIKYSEKLNIIFNFELEKKGVSIMVAVLVVVFVAAFNDWRKEKQFRGLKDKIDEQSLSTVLRNGQVKQIKANDLVVGDICCIRYGDMIPADGLLIQANDLKVDESSLTGETDLIHKNVDSDAILLSG